MVLGLALMVAPALAQEGKALSDAERARRDAEKVFSFIRFQKVGPKVAKPAASKPAPVRPKPEARAVAQPEQPVAQQAPAEMATATLGAASEAAVTVTELPAPTALRPAAATALQSLPTELVEEEDEEEEEVELKLRDFIAPELTPQLLATLGPNNPKVRLRFTVQADGRVSQAKAAAGVPRRLAQVAERALLQWRFDPLPTEREAEVVIAFKRD